MTDSSRAATIVPTDNPGLFARIAILIAIFLAEKILLDKFVDSEAAQAARGLGALVRNAQHWGFRYLVAFIAALLVIAYVRGGDKLTAAATRARGTRIRARWFFTHVLLVACLIPLSILLYRTGAPSAPFSVIVTLWLLFGIGAALSAFLAMAPLALWLQTARALATIWYYAAIAALLSVGAVELSQRLWEPSASLTFELVRRVLSPILPTMSADASTRILSTDRFAIRVAEACSGLEGMGLILVFTTAWLVYFRREYIFPRALILIPVGLATMFVLNVLRIATLMLIGYAGFPAVADFGFHSQAGWIAFIAAACGLVFFSHRSAWLNRTASRSTPHDAPENPTAAYLLPLLSILMAGVLSRAASGGFEFLYPLRMVAGAAMLYVYRRKFARNLDWRWSGWGPTVGVAVFVVWILGSHFLTAQATMPAELAMMAPPMRSIWIITRVAASVLIVPLAEEIAYRGFLMRRLKRPDFESVPFRSIGWPAVVIAGVASGAAYGTLWLPGIAAGIAYGWVAVRRGSIADAVSAHAVTNALVAVSVLLWGQWQLW